MDTHTRVAELFQRRFGHPCSYVARAPGRVNLLGEHVDYNDGFVLPIAIDRATYVALSESEVDYHTLWAADYDEGSVVSNELLDAGAQPDGKPLPDWAKYPAGVAWALRERGLTTPGLNALYASDVPRGAGLSSSASVELAFATAWKAVGGWSVPPMELALLCQRAENSYVGVKCGIMDQAASACGEAGRLLILDCRSLHYEALPLPSHVVVIIADTGVRHALAASAYNSRRAACAAAVRILSQYLPHITALRDVSLPDFNRLADKLPSEVQMRARHVVEEIDRTARAVELLRAGDVDAFGGLMNACHASLRDLYEVSCPELDAMVRIAQATEGCYGARLTGAGFGGCTVNLVAREQAAVFARVLEQAYYAEIRHRPEIYVCSASAGAGIVQTSNTEAGFESRDPSPPSAQAGNAPK